MIHPLTLWSRQLLFAGAVGFDHMGLGPYIGDPHAINVRTPVQPNWSFPVNTEVLKRSMGERETITGDFQDLSR